MSTVEAFQAQLGTMVVLVPGDPAHPPRLLHEDDVAGLRIFEHANPRGPVAHYRPKPELRSWELVEVVPATIEW